MLAVRIAVKEFYAFFRTPIGFFLIGAYLLLSMLSTFFGGFFFLIGNTTLNSFFMFQLDVFSLLIPILTMKLWADEYKTGTIELLLTRPISANSLVFGKFTAAWLFCAFLLAASFPLWISTSTLMPLDNRNILVNYFTCFWVCGALCALCCAVSSFCRNPVSACLTALLAVFLARLANFDIFLKFGNFSGELSLRMMKALNFDNHYQNLVSGQFSADDLLYFLFLATASLMMNSAAVDYKRG